MKKLLALYVSIMFLMITGLTPAMADTYTSTANGSWGTAGTWNPLGIPGATDTVNVNHAISYADDQDVGFLNLSGSLSGPAKLTIHDGGTWSGGTMGGGGIFNLLSSGILHISGANANHRWLGGTLDNSGTVNLALTSGFVFYQQNDSVINNLTGGLWDIKNDSGIYGWYSNGSPVINNAGTFRKSGGTGTSTIASNFNNLTGGVIQVQSGTLTLDGASSSVGGTFEVSAGAVLDLPNHTFKGTHSASGGGTVLLKNATIGSGGATFNFPGAMLQWAGGTIDTGSETLTNTGVLNISGANAGHRFLSGTLDNSGTVNQELTGGFVFYQKNDSVINNLTGGLWDIKNDGGINGYYSNGSPVINNAGTFRKSGGTGTSTIDSKFNNLSGGVISVQSGTLTLAGTSSSVGGIFAEVSAGAVLDLPNHTFQGMHSASGGGTILLKNATVGSGGATFNFPDAILQWAGGTIDTGSETLTNTGVLNISGANAGHRFLSGTLDNSGTVNQELTSGFVFYQKNDSVINNLAGGLWDIKNDGGINGYYSNGTPVINNAGTFRKSGGTGTSTIDSKFNNLSGGVISVQSGTLTLAGASSSVGGTFAEVSAGAVLNLPNHTFQGTHSATGGGTILLKDATIGSGGATFNFSGAMLQWAGGTINTGSETLTNTGVLNISGANAGHRLLSGTLDNSGTVNQELTGGFLFYQKNDSVINNLAGGLWDFKNDGGINGYYSNGSPVINNAGTFSKSGGTGTSSVDIKFNNTGTVEVRSGTLEIQNTPQLAGNTLTGGTWNVYGDTVNATLKIDSGSNIKTNQGNVTLSGTKSAFTKINTLENNEGSFTILNGRNFTTVDAFTNAGNLAVGDTSAFQVGATASLKDYTQSGGTTTVNGGLTANNVTINGGTLMGTGTITGDVTINGGTVAPGNSPGTLTITGSYTQLAGSTLAVDIQDTATYDKLNVSDTASLNGALMIYLLSSATIKDGDTFTVLTASSISGLFSSIADNSTAFDFTYDIVNNATAVIVTANGINNPVPLPPALLLFGSGLLGMIGYRLRLKWS